MSSHWQEVALGGICQIEIGGTPSRSEDAYWWKSNEDGERLPWVSISDLQERVITNTKEGITRLGLERSNAKRVPQGTLLMSFKLTIGKLALAGRDLYTNEAIASLHTSDSIYPEFLYYGLQYWDLTANTDQAVKGVTLNKQKLQEIPCLLPPLPEQKKIAEILSGIDKVISLLLLKNVKLEALKKAVSADLFSESLDISEIPAGWKLGCIGDIAKVVSGFAFSSKDFHNNQQEGIPVIRMSDIQQGCLNLGGAKRVSNYSCQVLKKFQVQRGDLLFGMSGSIEKSVLVKTEEQALLNQRVGALRSLNECNNFHAYAFQSEGVIDQILELAAGGAQLNISAKQVESIVLKIPPLPEQRKIAEILSRIDKRISILRLEKMKLETLKKAVSADLLSGRKRVMIQP